jgi:hypothetical protein
MNSGNYIDNAHSLVLLMIVLFVVSAAQHMFSKIHAFASPEYPTAIMAVLAGAVISLLAYLPIKYLYPAPTALNNNQVISMAVLLGIVASYFMVFEIKPGLPSVSAMALMVFMVYHHLDQLPASHVTGV